MEYKIKQNEMKFPFIIKLDIKLLNCTPMAKDGSTISVLQIKPNGTAQTLATGGGGLIIPGCNLITCNPVAAPANLTAFGRYSQILLSWNISGGGYFGPSFEIERTNPDASTEIIGVTSNLTFTDNYITPNDTYTYRVLAIDPIYGSACPEAPSSWATASAPGTFPPIPPAPTVYQSTSTCISSFPQITISWDAVPDIINYRLLRWVGDTNSNPAVIAEGSFYSYIDTDVILGTSYFYAVVPIAIDNFTPGEMSEIVGSSADCTPCYIQPATPTNLTATPLTNAVTLSWNWTDANIPSGSYVAYNIYRQCAGTLSSKWTLVGNTTSISFTDSNIPGSDAAPDGFRYMLRTFACGYESASSDFVTAIPTGGCPVYSAPSNLTASNSGCKSVNLSWSGSLPPGTRFIITKYVSSSCGINPTATFTALTNSYTDNSVQRGITYSYEVVIDELCSHCKSSVSNCASVTIPACPTMSTPSLSYAVNGSTVTLTWTSVSNADFYELWRSNGGTYTKIALLNSSTLTYTDYNLASSTYYYKVRAVSNCDCTSPYSTEQTVVITGGSSSISSALYYHEDHLGTIRLITSGDGYIISRHDYEPFGTEIPPLSISENTHRFTGHERDSATGNDYMINRFYSAGMGRFTRTDPVSGSPGDPQSWNMYAYVMNNPVGKVDPLGLIGLPGLLYKYTGNTSSGDPDKGFEPDYQADPENDSNDSDNQQTSAEKNSEPTAVVAAPTVEDKLTATIFSEMRGNQSAAVPNAIASVIVNNAQGQKGDSLSQKIEKEISNSKTYQGVGGKSYNAALKGEEGLKVISKKGQVAESDLISYKNANASAKAALSGKLQDTTGGATNFYSGDTPPYWAPSKKETLYLVTPYGDAWHFLK